MRNKEVIYARCEKILEENKEYMELQKKSAEAHWNNDLETYSELSIQIQILTGYICYKAAINDMLNNPI